LKSPIRYFLKSRLAIIAPFFLRLMKPWKTFAEITYHIEHHPGVIALCSSLESVLVYYWQVLIGDFFEREIVWKLDFWQRSY